MTQALRRKALGMPSASRYLATVRRATGMPAAARRWARQLSDKGRTADSPATHSRINARTAVAQTGCGVFDKRLDGWAGDAANATAGEKK